MNLLIKQTATETSIIQLHKKSNDKLKSVSASTLAVCKVLFAGGGKSFTCKHSIQTYTHRPRLPSLISYKRGDLGVGMNNPVVKDEGVLRLHFKGFIVIHTWGGVLTFAVVM